MATAKSSAAAAENAQRSTSNARHSTAEILRILHKWGIHTLGQLAVLDKEELRDRLGSEAVRLWERANGTATRLLKFVQPPETFDESFEFDHEIETAEPLLFILRRFLEQLSLRLSSIYLVAHELTLLISFSDSRIDEPAVGKGTYERVFKIPQPTNKVDLLFRMLQTHLENFKSEHPIVAVALRVEPSQPGSQQFGLFETALRNPQQLYETLARLTALVGNDRVGTPILEETHRPDAFRMEPFTWGLNNAGDTPAATEEKAKPALRNDETRMSNEKRTIGDTASPARTRPYLIAADTAASTTRVALRRFRPPASTSVFVSDQHYLQSDKMRGQIDDSPSGSSPSRASRPCRSAPAGSIVDQVGPFLLSGNWWDEKAWARAEWDMQLEHGELVRAHESPPCISAAPAALDRYPRGFAGHVARPARSIHQMYGGTRCGAWKLDGVYD